MRRKNFFIILVGIFIVTGWLLLAYRQETEMSSINSNSGLIRLHVLANSDSLSDQEVKLKVRDAIIKQITPDLRDVTSADSARKLVIDRQDELIDVAQQVLAANGKNYPVRLEIGMFDFPVKSYGNLTLPAGKYEAVRILLGKAEGKNWWCVLFPPLCFIDITNAAAIQTDNNESGLTQNSDVKLKLKIAELLSTEN